MTWARSYATIATTGTGKFGDPPVKDLTGGRCIIVVAFFFIVLLGLAAGVGDKKYIPTQCAFSNNLFSKEFILPVLAEVNNK